MARTKIYTLSPKLIDQTSRAVRQVREDGGSIATTPHASGDFDVSELWLELVDWDGAPTEPTYTANVWNAPYGGSKINATDDYAIAWNVWQKADSFNATTNTGTACGYSYKDTSIAVCGDYIGIEGPTLGRRYKALAYVYRPDTGADAAPGGASWGYVFDQRWDPIVKMTD